MKPAWSSLVAVALFFATTVCFGQQSFMDEPGIPAFTTSFPVEHGFINLANGNLHLEIPIASYPQRGNIKALHARLVYDSRFWTISTNNNEIQTWTPSLPQIGVNVGGMFRLVTDGEGGTWGNDHGVVTQCACVNVGTGQCQPRFKTTYSNYFYQDPAGTRHSPWWTFKMVNNDAVCGGGHPSGDANVYAADNSGYLLVIRNYSVSSVLAPDGTQVYPNVQDTNGNTYNTVQGQDIFTRNVVDTLGRTPVIATSSGNQWFLDYLCKQGCNSANGDRARVTVTSTSSPQWATQFNQAGVGEWSGPGSNLQSISLPDGTSYQFQYDSYGQITSMTLPTGGQISYGYTNFTDQGGDVNRWVTSMVRDGQTWNFTPTNIADSSGNNLQVTVTTPAYNDGNVTASDNHVYLFSVINQGMSSGSWNTQIQYFRGAVSGSPVLTKKIDYGGAGACPAFAGFSGFIPVPIRETLTWPLGSGTLSKKAEYCYDNYANVTATKEWDYQPNGNFAAAPDREIDNVYHTDSTADATFINANLIRLTKTSTTLSAGTQVAQTSFGYDETPFQASGITTHHVAPAASLGNQTSVTTWLNTGGSVTSSTKWFDTGEVYQSTDPLLHNTTLSYGSAFFGAYLTQACNALTPTQCSYSDYDFNTGLRTKSTDINGTGTGDAAHTTTYDYDTLLRPLCTNLPDGGQTCLSYPDANHVSRTQIITSALSDLSTIILDGFGRTVHTQRTLPAGTATVDTHYDPVGIPDTVSNPYFTTADPTYGTAQAFHDALGRTVKTIKQDGSVSSASYTAFSAGSASGVCGTSTDEAGNQRKSCHNGFGELVEVDEPNPGSVATNATGAVTISGGEQTTNFGVSITVANSGFETPSLGSGANAYQYHPTGSSWTFGANSGVDSNNNVVGGSGITGNNSGFTSSNPAAPEGAQVAFLQGGSANFISQSLSGFQAGVNYTVYFQAAQRGNFNAGGEDFDVYLDSTFLATFNPASTSYALLSTPAFTTTAGTHTIKFVGRDSAGGNANAAFIDAVQVTGSVVIPNSGFEAPALGAGNFQYSPTGGSWTFGGGTGISANGSDFTSGNPGAPDGSQVAFIQFGSDDVFSQSLSGFQTGVSYTVSFSAAQRGNSSNGGQDFDVYLDSTLLGTFRPASTSYSTMSTAAFTTTAGTHALRFVGRDSAGGNNTAFIDAVQITGTVGLADAGTVTISVNGMPYSTSFGSGDTPTTIASRLATTISAGSFASATASGATINLTSKTAGTIGDYSVTASYTWNNSLFTNPSFTTSTSGAALSGAYNAGDIGNNPFVTLYAHDGLGNLLRVDQKGTAPNDSTQWRTRTFTYDSLSRLLTATNPESGTISYSYDADGNLLQKTSPAPNQTGTATQTVSYCYDALHRVTGKGYGAQTCPLATPVDTYAYDSGTNGKGHLTSLADQAGSGIYGYDNMGRMITETRVLTGANNGAISKSASYDYNLDGSLYKLHYPSGNIVTYEAGAAGLTLSAKDSLNNINYVTSATYGPDSALTGFISGNSTSFAGVTNKFLYTPRLQPCRMIASIGGTLPVLCGDTAHGNVLDLGYTFHLGNGTSGSGTDNGNVYGITNYKDQTRNQAFAYDLLNRLTSAQNTGTDCSVLVLHNKTKFWGNSYVYDAWGNLLQKIVTKCNAEHLVATADAQNRIHVPTPDYVYDAAGNMTTDVTDGVAAFYDQENRISTATSGGVTTTYTYDSDGNRAIKSNGSTGTLYWYLTPGIVGESDLSGNLTDEYVFFDGERVARKSTNGVFYYFSDHLKTASVITDSAGVIKAESDYYPWGGELQFVNNDSNHYKFSGKERDSESGLDYFGARYYSNATGRWMSPDWADKPEPIPFISLSEPQTLNLYSYAKNSPNTFADIDGHDLKIAPELQARVDVHRAESPSFNAELAAHEGTGSPNLTIQFGQTPNDPNGQPTTGNTSAQMSPKIEVISSEDQNPDHYDNYSGATVTISNSIKKDSDAVDDTLDHEIGHVHDDRTNTDQAGRDAQHTKETHGKTPHDDRPEERHANDFKNKVKEERKLYKEQEKQKKKEEKKKRDQQTGTSTPTSADKS